MTVDGVARDMESEVRDDCRRGLLHAPHPLETPSYHHDDWGDDERLTRASQRHIYLCGSVMKLVNMVEFLQLMLPWMVSVVGSSGGLPRHAPMLRRSPPRYAKAQGPHRHRPLCVHPPSHCVVTFFPRSAMRLPANSRN